ncbi:hypothetical protein ACHWQZ_G016309 [Mnemiopsis leidyi]
MIKDGNLSVTQWWSLSPLTLLPPLSLQPSITRTLKCLTSLPIPTSLPTNSLTAFHNTLLTDRMSLTYLTVILPLTRSAIQSS